MSLKTLLGLGKKLFGKKPQQSPATGKEQKLLTYDEAASKKSGLELAEEEIKNPPVVLKKTKPLHMGDDTAPAFGSSTYDWIMKKGTGKFTADEWLDHLTSTRKVKFKIFNRDATKLERGPKRFRYDSGPFQGKEVVINKEELFDSNLAIFNDAGDLTGGLLFAAKKFGLKLDGNDLGAMIKLNPVNRLKAVEFGGEIKGLDKFKTAVKSGQETLESIDKKYSQQGVFGLADDLDQAIYDLKGVAEASGGKSAITEFNVRMNVLKNNRMLKPEDRTLINKVQGEVNAAAVPLKNRKTYYQGETSYTLQGGRNYTETVFHLDEPIKSNRNPLTSPGHFSDTGIKNQIYHVRYDTRFTPDGKKAFLIHEIQSDVNQSIAKNLSKIQQLDGSRRTNPFQADIELNLLRNSRQKLISEMDEALKLRQPNKVQAINNELEDISRKLAAQAGKRRGDYDYFPFVEADAYGDHALKYLVQKAAREGVDYVAVAQFNKLSFRQGYKAGNERFYGYASGKGIDKKGRAVMPELMRKLGNFYGTKSGPTKLSLSDPKLPYKKIETDKFSYPDKSKLTPIRSEYHIDAVKDPKKGYKLMFENDPRLYFDAFSIKVSPLMRQTQKTYRSKGGLVVDIFKPVRYNQVWL
jgi:soluble cytochrome b562